MGSRANDDLVGVWKLLRWERELPDGSTEPYFGARPVGMVIYEPGGYMLAQIMRSDDGERAASSLTETARTLARHYIAYYGRYEVDEPAGRVIHHVEASMNPNWVGGDQVRRYEISGDRLTLRPEPELRAGPTALYWERVGRLPAL